MYRIKTVAELTGIPRNTLIAWERRYGVPRPKREANGYRLYSKADVDLLKRIRRYQEQGLSISEALNMVKTEGIGPSDADQVVNDASEALVAALIAYDQPTAESVDRRLYGVPFRTRIEEAYLPALRTIGNLWEEGAINVAQEHYASAFFSEKLMTRLSSVASVGTGDRVACTTIADDTHEFGALALAVCLAERGYQLDYLGPNLPAEAMTAYLKHETPKWACLSIVRPRTADEIHAHLNAIAIPEETRFALGGSGIPEGFERDDCAVAIDYRDLAIMGGDIR